MSIYSEKIYADQADAIERGPQVYGGNAEIASLRAFRAYHPMAKVKFFNVDGRRYWLTSRQMRVKAIVDRLAGSQEQMSSLGKIAAEARVSPGYASKVIVRLRQMKMIGAVSSRGRYGGVFLWKVRKTVARIARAISGFNVSTVLPRGGTSSLSTKVETLKPWTADELAEYGL